MPTHDSVPRKRPTQDRSRATVERILDAAQEVLVERGYDGASTNRIAEAAGVSPGSLYQYFPNKDAVVAALAERYSAGLVERVSRSLMARVAEPAEELVPAMIRELVAALAEQPELLRALVERTPTPDGRARLAAFEQQIALITETYLATHRDRLRDADVTVASWILVHVARELSIRYVLDRPPFELAVLVEEASQLVLGYLRPTR